MARAVAVSLVQSRLDYVNSIFFGISKTNISKLQRVQNSLARIVLRRHSRCPSAGLLSELQWLPVEHRTEFKLAILTYKALSFQQPPHLAALLHPYIPTRSLRSSGQHLLSIPRSTTEFGRHAFSYVAPCIWNKIPLEIRSSPDIRSFKRKLKSHFLVLLSTV